MKILVISYYSIFKNNAGSERVLSFVDSLKKDNEIILLSFSTDYPEKKNDYFKSYNFQERKKSKRTKFHFLWNLVRGRIEPEIIDVNNSIEEIIDAEKIDLVFGSIMPASVLKQLHIIKNKKNIPAIVDIRDLDNFLLLQKNPDYSFKQRIYLKIKYYWIKKWLKNIDLITTTSVGIKEVLKSYGFESHVIFNGFESNENLPVLKSNTDEFTIGIYGTLYRIQDFSIFIDGILEFLSNNKTSLKIKFIGGVEIKSELKTILNRIPNENIELTNWLDKKRAIQLLKQCDICLYFGWKGYRGIYSAKIFEYLGINKYIILCPGDNDVLDDIIKKTKSGFIANNSSILSRELERLVLEKQISGKVKFNGDIKEIEQYSRKNQSKIFYRLVNEKIS